jgi:hypothetical protein
MDINKLIPGIIAAGIIGFISAGVMLFSDMGQMKLRMEYVEKQLDSCVTPDKLENAKLQISHNFSTHCK